MPPLELAEQVLRNGFRHQLLLVDRGIVEQGSIPNHYPVEQSNLRENL
jgi:hypothetical protein